MTPGLANWLWMVFKAGRRTGETMDGGMGRQPRAPGARHWESREGSGEEWATADSVRNTGSMNEYMRAGAGVGFRGTRDEGVFFLGL